MSWLWVNLSKNKKKNKKENPQKTAKQKSRNEKIKTAHVMLNETETVLIFEIK